MYFRDYKDANFTIANNILQSTGALFKVTVGREHAHTHARTHAHTHTHTHTHPSSSTPAVCLQQRRVCTLCEAMCQINHQQQPYVGYIFQQRHQHCLPRKQGQILSFVSRNLKVANRKAKDCVL